MSRSDSKIDASALLARIRERKRELANKRKEDQPPYERPNIYLDNSPSGGAKAKRRIVTETTTLTTNVNDPSELSYIPHSPPPSVDWWDKDLPPVSSKILHLVEIKNASLPAETDEDRNTTLYLTAKERRRKRSRERVLKRKDAEERVRLGIDPPAAAKLKSSNVAAIYGAAYYKDPSRYEQLAREAEESRRAEHEAINKARELDPDQRHEKYILKLERHRLENLTLAAFRITDLGETTGKAQFLVDYTAKKLALSGVTLMGANSIVIVEGGRQEVLKFKKLVLLKVNNAVLLWEGSLSTPHFKHWSLHKFTKQRRLSLLQNVGLENIYYLSNDT